MHSRTSFPAASRSPLDDMVHLSLNCTERPPLFCKFSRSRSHSLFPSLFSFSFYLVGFSFFRRSPMLSCRSSCTSAVAIPCTQMPSATRGNIDSCALFILHSLLLSRFRRLVRGGAGSTRSMHAYHPTSCSGASIFNAHCTLNTLF